MDDVTASGTVECSECGHVIEEHNTKGCRGVDGCTCRVPWTIAEIKRVRRGNGLPGEWRDR